MKNGNKLDTITKEINKIRSQLKEKELKEEELEVKQNRELAAKSKKMFRRFSFPKPKKEKPKKKQCKCLAMERLKCKCLAMKRVGCKRLEMERVMSYIQSHIIKSVVVYDNFKEFSKSTANHINSPLKGTRFGVYPNGYMHSIRNLNQ
eukprot:GHVL01030495.1.p1 GENE.GHVL01030495.1~~GHVL01030495.1.p1  ORF type:complete len:148 (+),score=18.83 GHVL01030495.1:440-883(+)